MGLTLRLRVQKHLPFDRSDQVYIDIPFDYRSAGERSVTSELRLGVETFQCQEPG